MKKNTVKRILCIIILLGFVLSINGCKSSQAGKTEGNKTVIHCVIGDEPRDGAAVVEKINARLEKEIGLHLEIKFIDPDKRDLLHTGGEIFDSLCVGDSKGFWGDTKKNAFAEITDEDLKTYAPNIAKANEAYLKAGIYNGKRYAIPYLQHRFNTNCIVVRGDLMDKYGIESIDGLESLGKYLDVVAKNEPGLIPYDVSGGHAYTLLAMFTGNRGWMSPGAPSATSPILMSANEGNENYLTLFNAIDSPEMLEYSKMMQEWKNRGYWSRSALSNQTSSLESFKGGRSATTWMPLESFADLYSELKNDERRDWDIRAYYAYKENPTVYSYMTNGVAISSASTNKENTLRVLDFLLFDQEANHLLNYGIEGVHYTLPDGKHVKLAGEGAGYYTPNLSTGIYNETLAYEKYFEYDVAYKLMEEIKVAAEKKPVSRVITNFVLDQTVTSGYESALNMVYQEYTKARLLGFVENVEEAIKVEKQKLIEAGIDKYREEIQKQFDIYCKENGLK